MEQTPPARVPVAMPKLGWWCVEFLNPVDAFHGSSHRHLQLFQLFRGGIQEMAGRVCRDLGRGGWPQITNGSICDHDAPQSANTGVAEKTSPGDS